MANTNATSSIGNEPLAVFMPNAAKKPTTSGPAHLRHNCPRVFVRRSRTFMRIIFNVTVDVSFGWFCQIFLGSFWEESFCMPASFMKPSREDVLDPVYPHRHVRGGQPRNFSECSRVHVFEIRDDDLSVERFELLNQRRKTIQIYPPVRVVRVLPRNLFQFFETHEILKNLALANHVRGGDMVRHAI